MREIPQKAFAAMVAVLPLPGSPRYANNDAEIIEQALSDVAHYREVGADCILLENSHDLPYIKAPLPEEGLTLMEHVAHQVRAAFDGPIGLQLLEAANLDALNIAHRAQLDFLRVEGYVFAHIGGAGLIEGCAGHLLRRRKQLGCEHIKIFGDLKKKHCSHALTADLDITAELKQAEFFHIDGVVVTGARTGAAADPGEVQRVQEAANVPVWIGSGLTPDNLSDFYAHADGFIVGSCFRTNGEFLGRLERPRLDRFMEALAHEKGRA